MTFNRNLSLFVITILLVSVKSEDLKNDDDDETDESEIETKNIADKRPPMTQFTYGDNDPLGPLHWRNQLFVDKLMKHQTTSKSLKMEHDPSFSSTTMIPSKLKRLYAHNFCQTNWLSPINIVTSKVRVPDLRSLRDSLSEDLQEETSGIPETLTFHIAQPGIQHKRFELGHPPQYNGIEIQPPSIGLIQLLDNFDPLPKTTGFTAYDFHFLSVFYCDLEKAAAYRTMHQIDGKRYPLELEFVFLRKAPEQDKSQLKFPAEGLMDENNDFENNSPNLISTLYENEYLAVIVSVLGEIGPSDNMHFKPVADAALKFHGKTNDHTGPDRNTKIIEAPWSPTWLLPDSSDYYYYDDASFPVPPCWSVQRFYVMRETIKISQYQLESLTQIQTEREKSTGNLMTCTHSIAIVNPEEGNGEDGATLLSGAETSVNLNLIEFEMTGSIADGKPRTEEEKRKMEERKKKRDIFRKRWSGERLDESSVAVDLNIEKWQIQILTFSTLFVISLLN